MLSDLNCFIYFNVNKKLLIFFQRCKCCFCSLYFFPHLRFQQLYLSFVFLYSFWSFCNCQVAGGPLLITQWLVQQVFNTIQSYKYFVFKDQKIDDCFFDGKEAVDLDTHYTQV